MDLKLRSLGIRSTLVGAAVVAVQCFVASPRAFGWNFDEHTELGRNGYQTACDQLAQSLKIDIQAQSTPAAQPTQSVFDVPDPCVTPKDQPTARWCIACRTFSPTLYGQSVAIAGDHVGDPGELMTPEGQVVAANAVDYTLLALVNVQHFHPAAPRNWQTFHDKALGLATKDLPNGPVAGDFAEIFYTSAYADHFLQDAFSAGHAGFNRPSTGAVAAKAFHDIWNLSGRRVRSPTGRCWLQYGDNKLRYASNLARFQIDSAETASVVDVLVAFVTGKRDAAREMRPVYYMPSEISPNPLPGHVWATRGESRPEKKRGPVVGGTSPFAWRTSGPTVQSAEAPETVKNPQVIDTIYWTQRSGLIDGTCDPNLAMVPIDGISNPAMINGGLDFWGVWTYDSQMSYGSVDVLYNHRLFSFMSLPFSWEGGLGAGYLQREGLNTFAPSVVLGGLVPPLYLIHGLWRNELGAQVKGYLVTSGPTQAESYVTLFVRSSLEVATWIVRLQAGPTVDFRSGRVGIVGALGLEVETLRTITGGGSLTDF